MVKLAAESSMLDGPVTTTQRGAVRVAVLLAAGRSTRLSARTGGSSKGLVRLGGMTLIERNVRALIRVGMERVVVVLGEDAARIEACLAKIPDDRLTMIRAENWELGNGASLMAARAAVGAEALFLLQMMDHLLSSSALCRLLGFVEPAVLTDPAPGAAWDGGTKVSIAGGRVTAFSKDIHEPAIDCGAFLVTPGIFDCFQSTSTSGDGSLASVLTRYAAAQPMLAVALSEGDWWQDIDTPADLDNAVRLLRRSLRKDTDGPIARLLNRPVSTRLSMLVSRSQAAPTLVTVLTSGVGCVAALLLGAGQGIAGGIATQLTSTLDGVDGEIARLQFRETTFGAFLDSLLDRLVDAAIIGGLGVWALAQGTHAPTVVVAVSAATAAVILPMATKDRVQLLGLSDTRDTYGSKLLGGRDGRLFCIALASLVGQPLLGLTVVVLTSAAGLTGRLFYVWHHRAPTRSTYSENGRR